MSTDRSWPESGPTQTSIDLCSQQVCERHTPTLTRHSDFTALEGSRSYYFELDLWSGPIARMIKHSAMTPSFKHAQVTVIATVFGAWFIWILCDTAILNALGPSSSRNKALDPGVRARTMLPLVRNAVFVTSTPMPIPCSNRQQRGYATPDHPRIGN
jgi:hypothetical protein